MSQSEIFKTLEELGTADNLLLYQESATLDVFFEGACCNLQDLVQGRLSGDLQLLEGQAVSFYHPA